MSSDAIAVLNQEIATREGFRAYMERIAASCGAMIPRDLDQEQVRRAAQRIAATIAALGAKNPDLRHCSASSLAIAVAECAALDLLPSTHRFTPIYLVPRRNKGQWEVSAQLSARGLATLAQRDGWTLTAAVVYEGEPFRLVAGTTPALEHEPNPGGCKPVYPTLDNVVGAYVVGQRPGSITVFRYLSREGILARKARAQNDSFWRAWPEEMILKTAIAYGLARAMIPLNDPMTHALRMVDREDHTERPIVAQPHADPLNVLDVPEEPALLVDGLNVAGLIADAEAALRERGWSDAQVMEARARAGVLGALDKADPSKLSALLERLEAE